MRIQEILRTKGHGVHSTSPESSLSRVVEKLVESNVGSLVVHDGDDMVGIITERDILRACATAKRPLDQSTVREYMSSELITSTSDQNVSEVMGLMTSHRIRHLPIVDEGKLTGIISIGDVVKAQHDMLTIENHYLKNYIQG